jgi:L-fucose dehydrogenase
MNLELEGKVALVTGATSGIGAEIARRFAEEKAIPVLVGRDKARGEEILSEIHRHQPKSILIQAELSESGACEKVVSETISALGKLDILINNAGGNDSVGLEAGPEAFVKSLERNLLHVYNLTHFCLPYLIQSKGNILNVGSKVADTGQGGTSGYAAAKGAMKALTREWALDLRQYGIRVNEVLPAEVLTLSYEKWIQTFPDPQKRMAEIVRHIPLGQRFTTTKEIADMVLFLTSGLSDHTTGQHIYVDGGYTHLDRAAGDNNQRSTSPITKSIDPTMAIKSASK